MNTHISSTSETLVKPTTLTHAGCNWLSFYSKLVCFSVLFLIFKGALVTSHDAGLAVPDWPTSFGENMFLFPPSKWRGIIFFEHVHRLIASFVGLLTLILTAWVLWVEKRRWVKTLSVCALCAVVLQGVLGGLTVIYLLPTAVSSSHAVLGQTFFLLTLVLAYSLSSEGSKQIRISRARHALLFPAFVTFIAVYFQLILGAVMRHSEAGLAVLDLFTIGGEIFPSFSTEMMSTINSMRGVHHLGEVSLFQVGLHVAHRIGGVIITLLTLWLLVREIRIRFFYSVKSASLPYDSVITRNLYFTGALVLFQFSLGMLSVYSLRNAWIASAHVLTGALLIGSLTLLCVRLFRAR